MTDFRFAFPFAFLLLMPIVLLMSPAIRQQISHKRTALRYSDTRLLVGLPSSLRLRLRWIPDILKLLIWILLVIAFARPQSGQESDVITGQGIDIVLALDISSSMASLDFQPLNRLETAKEVIGQFINAREFDRIGLTVFARSAFHHAPLTLDYDVLLQLLDRVPLASELTAIGGRKLDGSAIGLGLAAAGDLLRGSHAASKVVILLTDGSNNEGISPVEVAKALKALDIRVYTIGMGKLGLVEFPDPNGEIITVPSELNEDDLRAIAEITDGLYFRAEDLTGLQRVYERIDQLERSDVERRIFVRWKDRGFILIELATILLILERILRLTAFQTLPETN